MGSISRGLIKRTLHDISQRHHSLDLIRDADILLHEVVCVCVSSDSAYDEDFDEEVEMMDPQEWSSETKEVTDRIIQRWRQEAMHSIVELPNHFPFTAQLVITNGTLSITSITPE